MLNSSLENKINLLKPDSLEAKTNEKFWRKHFIQFEESGLSHKKYCRENSLSFSKLNQIATEPDSAPAKIKKVWCL